VHAGLEALPPQTKGHQKIIISYCFDAGQSHSLSRVKTWKQGFQEYQIIQEKIQSSEQGGKSCLGDG